MRQASRDGVRVLRRVRGTHVARTQCACSALHAVQSRVRQRKLPQLAHRRRARKALQVHRREICVPGEKETRPQAQIPHFTRNAAQTNQTGKKKKEFN